MAAQSTLIRLTLFTLAALTFGRASLAVPEAEKVRLSTTLADFSRQLAALERNPSLGPFLQEARQRIQWFENKLASWSPASADEGRLLREGLEIDMQALQRLPAEPDAASAVLREIEADLSIKEAHCRIAGLAALVTTKVHTFRGGKEVEGLEVFYIQKVLESNPPANPPRFPALSATEQKLAPGRYVFWAGDSFETADRSTIAVGHGESDTTIHLLVR